MILITTFVYCSWFAVCWRLGAVRLGWYPGCRVKPATRTILQPNLRTITRAMVISVKRNACAFTSAAHRITSSFSSSLRFYLRTPHLINGVA